MAKTSPAPQMTYEELHAAYLEQQKALEAAHAEIDDLHSNAADNHQLPDDRMTLHLTDEQIHNTIETVEQILLDMQENWTSGPELSAAERNRMQGLRAARYGLVDEISDVITVAPQFMPSFMTEAAYKREIRVFELMRGYTIILEQMTQLSKDIMLVLGDSLYRQALSYYGAVRDADRRRAPGAKVVYERLKQFFRRFRNLQKNEPTERQLEKDFRALLHGHKDGTIEITGEADRVRKGNRTVIDDTHKAHGAWRETESGEIDE